MTQPWASLVAGGAKCVETRGWKTDHRGPIAIHAAKTFPLDARRLCIGGPGFIRSPFREALQAAGFSYRSLPSETSRFRVTTGDLPLGMVIAIAELVDVQRIGYHVMPLHPTNEGHQCELAFGDYTEGRYAWRLENVQPLPEPIPARGALSLWEWAPPPEVTAWTSSS